MQQHRPRRHTTRSNLVLAAIVVAAPAMLAATAHAEIVHREKTQSAGIVVERVASGLQNPWGLAFLPDGRMLVTERPGRLRVVSASGEVSPPVSGAPSVWANGQGGLLDVALAPDFAQSRLVYMSFAQARDGGAVTAVARGRLNDAGTALEGTRTIFSQTPVGNTGRHFGSRLVFDRGGNLFVTTGDRGNREDDSQDPAGLIGKVIRLAPDGGVPKDNPFVGREGYRPEIWSLGHRNAQGAALHPQTGRLWTSEHGSRGGDEINVPLAGRNYGWPVITYGIDYSGAKIGEGTAKPGMEQPIYYWDPSIAPSGLAFYTADRFPGWRGSAFTGALAGQMLVRLSLDGERVTAEERLLRGLRQRIRDVRQGPDGFLYLLTDSRDGQLLRVRPE